MNIVIVELPAKAKTINKYLGSGYKVLASYGHVRDLPSKDGSVQPDNDFEMHWDVEAKAPKRLDEIAEAVKNADKLILATDPDREGEAISWHICQVLKGKKALKGLPVERVIFNAITKQAVLDAMRHPREIDAPLVDAYLARRALDYLVGFTLSPVLWRKLPGARSAGRVQSVALRLVCDREAEIEAFKTQEYWTIDALLATAKNEKFVARLTAIDGKKLEKLDIEDEASAMRIKAAIEGGGFIVQSVEKKAQRRNPAPPFTTSTLQQEASRKLGFSAKQTMQVAQRLYEGVDIGGETVGLITYMRTDGVQIVPEAIAAARRTVEQLLGGLPAGTSREYKTKAKNAQEAHEAIRPTDVGKPPEEVARYLEDEARALRADLEATLASQASAELEQTTAEIGVNGKTARPTACAPPARSSASTASSALRGRPRRCERRGRRSAAILAQGDQLKGRKIEAKQHFTEPPPRYTEATLVKQMEELGIGRPSTYASTLAMLRDRDYVRIDKKRLHPRGQGPARHRLPGELLQALRRVRFHRRPRGEARPDLRRQARLEGRAARLLARLHRRGAGHQGPARRRRAGGAERDLGPHIFPRQGRRRRSAPLPVCETGRLSLKIGKFGAFIGCSNYPDCRFTRQLADGGDKTGALGSDGKLLGNDPETELDVTLRTGRFGPYVQLGETARRSRSAPPCPRASTRRASISRRALQLLSLPREVGLHPETGKPITAGFGRYGPFILHDGTYANLTASRRCSRSASTAPSLLAEKAGEPLRRGATVLKDLGEHPEPKAAYRCSSGRYGPYVKHGKVNATLPKDRNPEEVTMDEAVELIAERAAKGPAKKPAAQGEQSRRKTQESQKEVVEETAQLVSTRAC